MDHIITDEPTQYCSTCGWTGEHEETQVSLDYPEKGCATRCPICHGQDLENLDDEN